MVTPPYCCATNSRLSGNFETECLLERVSYLRGYILMVRTNPRGKSPIQFLRVGNVQDDPPPYALIIHLWRKGLATPMPCASHPLCNSVGIHQEWQQVSDVVNCMVAM